MRRSPRQQAAAKSARMRELTPLGYKSDVFAAKYRGGTCGLSGIAIRVGDPVAFFREHGLCHAGAIDTKLWEEKQASAPKCGCGTPITDGNMATCRLCDYVCEHYFDQLAEDVTRDSTPIL